MRRHQNVEVDDPRPKKARIAQRASPTPSARGEDEENEAFENAPDGSEAEVDLLNMPIPDRPIPVMTTNPNDARLIITKIVVENFKSYYGKKILGPFHKNYTSILGPNGSGKSNVIDSLLFVFGFRASKIRSKKLSVLIHNSRDHKNVASCSVSVHFAKVFDRGPDNYEVKSGTEFSISRTVHKAGNSTYRINGVHASTDDVKSTLKNNGIDLDHNRFLILQGEVEQIALMKPKHDERSGEDGMLEYLEDIIGSSRLKRPINLLKARLESYANEMDMVSKRLQLATKEVDDMTAPVMECLKLMRMENKITMCKHRLLSLEQLKKSREFDAIQIKYEELLAQKREVEEEVSELEKKNSEASERKNKAISKEARYKEKTATLKKRLADATFELKNHDTEVLRLEKKVKDKEKELEKQQKKATDIDNLPIVTKARLDELAELSEQRNREIAESEVELHDLRKEEQKKNLKNRQELADLMPLMTEHNAEEDTANAEFEMAKDKVKRLEELQSNPQEILRNAEDALKRSEEEVQQNERDLTEFQTKLPVLKKDVDELGEEVADLRREESNCVTNATRLRQELDSQRAKATVTRQKSQVLEALMERSRTGRIQGILGRLGDLGAIDAKYDVAISTCCGALDNVLVESVDAAQQCIEFLKTRNLPRMTFLALDKQTERYGNKSQGNMHTPQNVPRLFDLIEVQNKRFLPAFYYALQDTLVAENIDLANQVSKAQNRRWRVVTLHGELIETSGTLSGGGRSQKRGMMGAHIRVEDSQPQVDLDKLQADCNNAERNSSEIRRKLHIVVEKHREAKEELFRLENKQKLCHKKTEEYRRRRQDAGRNVANAKKAVEESSSHDEQIRASRKDMEKWKKARDAVCSKASTIRAKKEMLEKRISDVQDEVIGDVKRRLERLKAEFKEAQTEINKENVALKNAESTRRTLEKRIESLRKEISEATKLVDEAGEQKAKIERIVEKCGGELEQYEEKLEELKEEVNAATEMFAELTKTIDDRRAIITEKGREIHAISRQLAECQDKLNDIKADLSSLALHNVNINVPTRRTRPTEEGPPNDDVMAIDVPPNPNTENEMEIERSSEANASVDIGNGEEEAENDDEEEQDAGEDAPDAEENPDEAEDSTHNGTTSPVNDEAANEELDDGEATSGVLPTYSAAVIEQFDEEDLKEKLQRFTRKREKCKTKVNVVLIEEFLEKMERHDAVNMEMSELRELADSHKKKHDSLRRMRSEEFLEGFQNICLATQEIYQMITLGGDAALELVDSIDPFKDGVSFQVRPPKKTWKQITNLSGGEKTLASLALVFGLHTYRPTPLYVMDEIDAALDYRNVSIISTYLKERTKNAQFIIISLRNNMFENGDRLLGIYKVSDCTYNIAFDPDDCDDDSD